MKRVYIVANAMVAIINVKNFRVSRDIFRLKLGKLSKIVQISGKMRCVLVNFAQVDLRGMLSCSCDKGPTFGCNPDPWRPIMLLARGIFDFNVTHLRKIENMRSDTEMTIKLKSI